MAIRLTILWLFVSLSSFGQLVTLPSLDVLLNRTPIRNETLSVASGLASNDWGGVRLVRHYTNNSGFATNAGNVFQAKGATNGQWVFLDRTNSVQRLPWWGGGPAVADNTRALTNAANFVSGSGGGYVKADTGTHTFLSGGINLPSGARIIGAGPNATVFDFTAAALAYDYEHCMRWIGELSSGVGIVSDTVAGGKTMTLTGTLDLAVGDQLQIRQTNYFSFGGRRDYSAGEFNFVATVTGGTNLTLNERLEQVYPAAYTRVAKVTPTVGSVEGVHFALGVKVGPVMLDYADGRSYFRNCSAAGSETEHFSIRRSYGTTVSGLFVEWDSEPVGMNYALVVGDSEYVTVRDSFFRTGRAGFDAGGSTIPTRYLTVVNTTMGSTRTTSHGAGLHEDVVESTFDSCVFLSGVSLGGGRNRLLNSVVKNNTDRASVAVPAGRYFDWEVRGNQIESAVDPTLGIVYGLRMYLQAGSQGSHPESTNYWPGTFGGTENQSIRITDNRFRIVGAITNTQFPLLIDEASTLTANTNISPAMFGRLEIARNQFFYDPAQPTNEVTSGGVVVQLASKIRWPEVIITDNLFASGPPQINLTGGKLVFRNNTVQQSLRKEGVYIHPLSTADIWAPLDVVIDGNTWLSPLGLAFFAANTGGRLVARDNRVFDHGAHADTTYKFAFKTTETTTNAFTDVELVNNLFSSTNSPSYDVSIYTTVAPLWEYGTQLAGSTTAGSRNAGGGYLRLPRLLNSYGSTNAITALGQYTALPTASSYPPGLAHSAGDLWYSDGISWTNFMRSGKTTFPSMYVTNDLSASNIVATTTTLRDDGSRGVFANPGTYPFYVYSDTNTFTRLLVNNINNGSSAASLFQAQVTGAQGYFGAYSTNNSSGNARARAFMSAITGAGLAYDLAYPSSMDVVWTYGGGTEFARLSTNTFSLPGLTTLGPTNVPTHVAMFDADPTSTRRPLKSVTLANLKNSLAITAADITDSTSSGRALLTSASASDQRTSLGLGTAATLNVPAAGNAASGEVVKGSDTRLTDSRTPTSHTHPSTDISDSTSAGRALLTAANAAAQRSSLGLGTIATIDDAPSDGNQYVRSNATWAITSGGGGGSAGPTNILKLYDHYGAAPPYTNAHVSLISDAISIGWADSTYGTLYDAISIERLAGYSAKQIKLLPLTIGIAGFRQKDPASSTNHIDLSSVGFNGAVPVRVVNFNDTTPAAPSVGVNVKWQTTSTNVSAYVPLSTVATFKAQDGEPPTSSYATFSTRNSIGVMLFDPAAQEAMRYRFVLPYGYSAANATVILKWTTSATSGDARWGARFMALTGDIDSDSFATAVEGTTTTSATAGTVMTTTLSAVGLDSAVAGDGIWLEVYRDVGDAADTIDSNDLELHSVEVRVE